MRDVKVERELVDQILAAVAGGESYRDIKKWAKVSISTVSEFVHADRVLKQQVVPKPRAGSLRLAHRIEIKIGIDGRETNAAIAGRVGFHAGSVGREINANGGRGCYEVEAAQQRSDEAKKRTRESWIVARAWLWDQVQERLRLGWSPQQISNRLRKDHPDDPDWHVSHETIYEAIFVQAKPELRKELAACLRSGRAKRVPHGRSSRRNGSSIKNMVNISERPAEVEDRAIPGHWEGDLIVGKNNRSYIATLVERKTRYALLIKLDSKNAEHVAERISQAVNRLDLIFKKSLTWDCGTELADHQTITTNGHIDVYFCDPHSPWQRGSNENFNSLARQYLPKSTNLSEHSQDELDHIAYLLNTRPRQTLDWNTPAEEFNQLIAATT